jgi:hypothetical protein
MYTNVPSVRKITSEELLIRKLSSDRNGVIRNWRIDLQKDGSVNIVFGWSDYNVFEIDNDLRHELLFHENRLFMCHDDFGLFELDTNGVYKESFEMIKSWVKNQISK